MEETSAPNVRMKQPADQAVGLALQVLTVIVMCGVLLGFAYVSLLTGMMLPMFNQGSQNPSNNGFPGSFTPNPEPPSQVPILVEGIILVVTGLLFFVATRLKESKRWAFQACIVIAAIGCLGGSGLSVLSVSLMDYCVVRLNGMLGVLPT